jgi:hypothetical protein
MADKKTFPLAEVKKHNNATSSWLVIHKYDPSKPWSKKVFFFCLFFFFFFFFFFFDFFFANATRRRCFGSSFPHSFISFYFLFVFLSFVCRKVYDVTKFLDEHPGGAEILVENAGLADASAEFDSIGHSSAALEMLKSYYIGDVEESK